MLHDRDGGTVLLTAAGWSALARQYNSPIRHTLAGVAGAVTVVANPAGQTALTVDDSGEVGRVSQPGRVVLANRRVQALDRWNERMVVAAGGADEIG